MKFKSILSFFKKSERTVESLPTMDFFFTGSLLNDNFHNIESMLNEGFQINEEHSEILKEKLQDLASYFYPRSFYKVGLHLNGKIIPNKISQYIQKSTWGSQYDIKREIEHNINSLSIPLQLKQMRYFQIISKHNLLDDFILENIQTQSNIGQFFNVISGINKYYINNFNSETLENYNNNLNLEYSNIYKENPLFKSDSLEKYIKRKEAIRENYRNR